MDKEKKEKYRLLLVDDGDSFLATTKAGMEEYFPDIEVVLIGQSGAPGNDNFRSAGQNALNYLEKVWKGEESVVHCILIDHNMPEMSGLDLLHKIKKKDTYAPVVMLTGDDTAMEEGSIKSFENGARGYLFKTSKMFFGELYTTIVRVYKEIIREKWLITLADIASINTNKIPDLKVYAEEVLDKLTKRFTGGVIFIRERKKEDHLYLLASFNVTEELLENVRDIKLDNNSDLKKRLEQYNPTSFSSDNAWNWAKETFGLPEQMSNKIDKAFFIPLRYAQETLGCIVAYITKNQSFFLEEEKAYVDTLTSILSSMFFQYEYRYKLLTQASNVTKIIKSFNEAKEEAAIYKELVKQIHSELNQKSNKQGKGKTSVKIIISGTDKMKTEAYEGEPRSQDIELRVSDTDNGNSGWVAFYGKPRLVVNKDDEKDKEQWVSTHIDMVSSITVPLLNEVGRPIAVLNSENSEPNHFNEDDLNYAESLSHIAAVYVTRLRSQNFFNEILEILSNKDAGSNELLRLVIKVIKEFLGYSAMIVAIQQSNGKIALARCDGYNSDEEGLLAKALRGELDKARPLVLQSIQDNEGYEWSINNKTHKHKPWFPSEEMKNKIKYQRVFILRLSSGEPIGAFCVEFEVDNAIDELQNHTIRRILPIIARLLWDKETHQALKNEIELLRVDKAFSMALRQIAHNLHHVSFNIGGQVNLLENTENLTDNGKQRLEKIMAFASEIDKLEKNIRSLSRVPEPKMIEILSCWKEVEKLFSARIKQHKIKIDLQIPENINGWCDPLVLSTVLMNLIDNSIQAIEDCPMEKEPKILLEYYISQGIGYFFIEDNGPGFKNITPERAMDWFVTTRSAGGSGIGLPFAREIIRKCKGDLKIIKPRKLTGAAIQIILKKKGE